jgi:uncharacterized Fe-S cluster-containing radical SAM superfamily protein
MRYIESDRLAERYRSLGLDKVNKKVRITNYHGTEQEKDLTEPANCEGYGRLRHFKMRSSNSWTENPLPILPACKALGLFPTENITAQVFQTAMCNWRCWYCYVPFNLLTANKQNSDWLSAKDLITLYLSQPNPPLIIDLSGGQPDLTPEWLLWVMNELIERGIDDKTYLWSDDNLSNDYFWKFLSRKDIKKIIEYRNYGRVGCFKGFDEESFSFNTLARKENFTNQFKLMQKYVKLGIDIYCYATFTSPNTNSIQKKIKIFIERLQQINYFLPLRLIPLEVKIFSPVSPRLNYNNKSALDIQYVVIEEWKNELKSQYQKKYLETPITDIKLD